MKKFAFFLLPVLLLALAAGVMSSCSRPSAPADVTETGTPPATGAEDPTEEPTAPVTDPATEPETEAETESEVLLVEREIGQRYFIYRIWNFNKLSLNDFKSIVDAVTATGFNAIKVHIPWTWVERTDGVYDFADFDAMVDYVVNEKQLSVAISLDMTRMIGDTVIPEEECMRSRAGVLSVGGTYRNRTQISFASAHAVDKAAAFYETAVRHYDSLFGGTGRVLFYLPAFSQYCETEYWCAEEYDYSPQAVAAFRKYLASKYDDISEINALARKSYTSFSEIEAPKMSDNSDFSVLWYQYRHLALKAVIDRLADAQHAACPDTKFALQFGCVYDPAARRRGTLGFVELCEKADVLWVDDGPTMNHDFSMDYMWSMLPAHIELAQEIDGPGQYGASVENYLRQGLECYDGGVKYLSIANWSIDGNYYAYEPAWKEILSSWTNNPDRPASMSLFSREDVRAEDYSVYEISLFSVFRATSTETFMAKYKKCAKGGTPVVIRIEDDLLHVTPSK